MESSEEAIALYDIRTSIENFNDNFNRFTQRQQQINLSFYTLIFAIAILIASNMIHHLFDACFKRKK